MAIELAAARVRMMPPARIAAALDDRFRLLTGGARTVLPRQQTLETSVAWSHDLLDDAERALLRRLSVFAGGFTLDAAEHVCTGDVVDRYTVLDLLTRLVDKSLVQADVDDQDGRYWLLETIKFFARGRLAESGETDWIQERHRDYFLALAEQAEPELVKADGLAWLDRLQREWDNLSAAADWCEATAAHQPFLRLVTALTLFFELRSHLAAGGRWFARALIHDEGPSALRARALWGAAHVAFYGGDVEALGRHAPAALAMAEEVGDEAAKCRALNTNGVVASWLSGNVEEGRAAVVHSVTLSRQLKDNWALCDGLKLTTISWMIQDDYVGLSPVLAEFKAVSEALGNRFFMAWYHTTVGWAAMHHGDFTLAEQEMELALAEDKELGGAATAGFVVAQLGEVEAQTGRYDAAESRLVPFLGRAAATGDFLGAPWAVPALARLLIGRGAPADALDMIAGFVDLLRPLGMPLNVSEGLNVLGAAHLALGDEAAAAEASPPPRLRLNLLAIPGWGLGPSISWASSPAAVASWMRPRASTTTRWPCGRRGACGPGWPNHSRRWPPWQCSTTVMRKPPASSAPPQRCGPDGPGSLAGPDGQIPQRRGRYSEGPWRGRLRRRLGRRCRAHRRRRRGLRRPGPRRAPAPRVGHDDDLQRAAVPPERSA
ncbi:hypothetical protein [Mesorhizobium sp.]|uniref:ATP-binding protein n=1 Tax=Mesorhizobium sp. TaxID=1871066 RepID=UPI000FE4D1A0|nr:hypothetical protein [Mesorhizobium sp.]RWQ49510.1 MAG: hypothetical protein EOS83_24055 [Mesorhizobium sp.]